MSTLLPLGLAAVVVGLVLSTRRTGSTSTSTSPSGGLGPDIGVSGTAVPLSPIEGDAARKTLLEAIQAPGGGGLRAVDPDQLLRLSKHFEDRGLVAEADELSAWSNCIRYARSDDSYNIDSCQGKLRAYPFVPGQHPAANMFTPEEAAAAENSGLLQRFRDVMAADLYTKDVAAQDVVEDDLRRKNYGRLADQLRARRDRLFQLRFEDAKKDVQGDPLHTLRASVVAQDLTAYGYPMLATELYNLIGQANAKVAQAQQTAAVPPVASKGFQIGPFTAGSPSFAGSPSPGFGSPSLARMRQRALRTQAAADQMIMGGGRAKARRRT